MECRNLEIKVIGAQGLKNVNVFPFTKMKAYAVVSIINGSDNRITAAHHTLADKKSGSNPKWNHAMRFTLNEAYLQQNCYNLEFCLKSSRKVLGDKVISSVEVPVKDLFDRSSNNNGTGNENIVEEQKVSCSVWLPNGKAKGVLDFSYKFGDNFNSSVLQHSSPWVTGAMPAYHPPPPPPPTPAGNAFPTQGGMGGFAGQLASRILIDALVSSVIEEIGDAFASDF